MLTADWQSATLHRMQDAAVAAAQNPEAPIARTPTLARANISVLPEVSLATGSALLLILSFPDFDLWPLAWIGLVPLLFVAGRASKAPHALIMGWWWGLVFFYGTCWWLAYSMMHYGHIRPWLAYTLLIPPATLVALFPALFCLLLARLVSRFGPCGLFVAPFLWVSLELARYAVTGLMWNAIGYSQAFHPFLIQSARWGGVYAVSFLILMSNAAIAFVLVRRSSVAAAVSLGVLALVSLAVIGTFFNSALEPQTSSEPRNLFVAVQPNVPMESSDDPAAMQQLLDRHLELGTKGVREGRDDYTNTSLVIWPESPMNFSYSRDSQLRETVASFAGNNHAFVLLNSLEPAPNGGEHNSAILVNQEGRKVAQYDKIRLMPFGEYVPLPRWLPGASSVRAIVGDFTPGSSYTLMPLGDLRAGVFICIEAAHPSIARTFTGEGADVLINISNDGYLGPTPVMRQHLANSIFRVVENDRDLLRVTNTGISAYIDSRGRVMEQTRGFEPAVRSWTISRNTKPKTFYTQHGDVLAYLCALISLGLVAASFLVRRKSVSEARP